jgi:ethanolamine-phosphate cytidylyltransferase
MAAPLPGIISGVNDDASITQCKGGPPLLTDSERLVMVRACKWVDEVVSNVPYIMSEEYLRWAIKEYKIDYVVHGDDPCIVDGRDVYESARKLGKYRTIPRTEGVSTTEIVGRMLLASRHHHTQASGSSFSAALGAKPTTQGSALMNTGRSTPAAPGVRSFSGARRAQGSELTHTGRSASAPGADPAPGADGAQELRLEATPGTFVRESRFLTTSQMVRLFSQDCVAPPEGARIVYVDGGWDMFHAGHVDFLQAARKLGDYLLVGVHSDAVVNRHRGHNYPILNQQERVLSVLACRYTSDVVIDPPWYLTREMIAALGISVVAHGAPQYKPPFPSRPFCSLPSPLPPPPALRTCYNRSPWYLTREMIAALDISVVAHGTVPHTPLCGSAHDRPLHGLSFYDGS